MGRIGVMPFRESVSSLEITNMFGMELGYDRFNKESLQEVLKTKQISGKEFDWIKLSEKDGSKKSTPHFWLSFEMITILGFFRLLLTPNSFGRKQNLLKVF